MTNTTTKHSTPQLSPIIAIFMIFLLVGCGASKNFTPADQQSIQTIAVSPSSVILPEDYIVIMGGGGLVGALLDIQRNKSPKEILKDIFTTDDMLKNTVSQAFEYQIRESNFFKIIDEQRADAYMEIKVSQIQFLKNSWTNSTKLMMRLEATIKTDDERIVWQDWGYISGYNDNIETAQFTEFLTNTNKLKKGISIVSQLIIREFIEESGGTPAPLNKSLYKESTFTPPNEVKAQLPHKENATLPSQTPTSSSISSRLEELKNMHDNELITQEEYDAERQELLDEL